MARTTDEQVAEIIEVDDNIDLTPFIATATAVVDRVEAANADATDSELELIERWLTAHYYAIRDPRAVSEKAGPVGATYQSKVGMGFANTHYGQQAMLLDSSGTLTALNNSKGSRTASLTWIGTASS